MPSSFILLISTGVVLYLLYLDSKNEGKATTAFWIFTIWFFIVGSRPLSLWISQDVTVSAETGTENNPINTIAGLLFTTISIIILIRRRVNLIDIIRNNFPLTILVFYCLLSCVWSDFPAVSFRRWIHLICDIFVVLALLSEENTLSVLKKLFRRYTIFVVITSIILIKYLPNLGVMYSWSGEAMWLGVCVHKNALGVALTICVLFFLWKYIILRDYKSKYIDLFLFLLSIYLMFFGEGKGSSTSQLSLLSGVLLIIIMRYFKNNINNFLYIFYILIFSYFLVDILANIIVKKSLLEIVTVSSGRDMTFTGRTDIWKAVLDIAKEKSIFGTGYGVFWAGPRLRKLWDNPAVFEINQSHNGFIETYANLGIIGLLLFILTIIITIHKLMKNINISYFKNSLCIAIIVPFIIAEFFEALFLQPSSLRWVVFLLCSIDIPTQNYDELNDTSFSITKTS